MPLIRYAAAAIIVSTLVRGAGASPEVPGQPQHQPVALVGATIHPVSGPEVPNGTLLFEGGKILAVGTDIPIPSQAQRIKLPGKHIYPGLFDAYTSLGLTEIDAVRATRDETEAGEINPNVKAQVALNPDSDLIPVARSNGVLLVLTAPTGGLISGTSAVTQLDGWTWEDMTLRAPAGLHIDWPRAIDIDDYGFSDELEQIDQTQRVATLKRLRQAFADARAYLAAKQSNAPAAARVPYDARWEAMGPFLEGQAPVIIRADEVTEIQSAVAFAMSERIKPILLGGYDAPACADLLKKHDIPVIVAGIHRLPRRDSDAYDDPFTVPERLRQAGIRYCISGADDAWNVRNLPYQAATAAAYGLPAEEALKAITLYPAQILSVADRVGSLEVGKEATLIITNGDPLEITSNVEMAYIQGRPVDLSDRQKRLWEKYKEKYRRLGIEN